MVDFLSKVKSEPPVKEKWQEVYNIMSPHTQGSVPTKIFKERRPLESKNTEILDYRNENSRPITTAYFKRAEADYLEVINSLDYKIDYNDSPNKDYIEDYKLPDGLKLVTLKHWVTNKNGSYKQTDPNAVTVILPKHTTKELIPSYTDLKTNIPNFNEITTERIETEVRLIGFDQIQYADAENFMFKAGTWQYGSEAYEKDTYFFALTKDKTFLIYPVKDDNIVKYVEVVYYNNNLSTLPAVVIGNLLITETDKDGNVLEYYVSDYFGAAAWGDLAIGQASDLQICEARFTYPRHWKIKIPCDNTHNDCHLDLDRNIYLTSDNNTCTRCAGTGFIQDASPSGSILIKKGGLLFDQDGKFQEPEGFITPDTEILKHSADRVGNYMEEVRLNLNISNQNNTNASAEAKNVDLQHKVSTNTRIVTGVYHTYLNVINIIDEYRGGKGEITITFPEDFDIKNANDILTEISEAKNNKLPYMVIVELTKKYMLKKFGKSPINNFIIDFLSLYDVLFAYSLEDMQTLKGSGVEITAEQIAIHANGYQLLRQISQDEDSFMKKTFVEIKTELDKEIQKFIQVETL